MSNECSETGGGGVNCKINLPTTYLVLCAETVRDKIGGIYEKTEMCDCIIFDSQEEKISLVELKSGTPTREFLSCCTKPSVSLQTDFPCCLKFYWT